MPYNIKKSGNKYEVVGPYKDKKSHVYGTHNTEKEARAQQKVLYMKTEAANHTIKHPGGEPTPATQLTPVDNVPSRKYTGTGSAKVSNDGKYLPTHIDNRELQIGIQVEMIKDPAIKGNKKQAVYRALNHLDGAPQYYSTNIVNGKINNPEILKLFTQLFKRDRSFLVPKDTKLVNLANITENKMKLTELKRIIRNVINESSSGYQTYHPTYTSAVKAAEKYANSKGFEVDEDDC